MFNSVPTSAAKCSPESLGARKADLEAKRLGRRLAGGFLFIGVLLALGGFAYLSHLKSEARLDAYRELGAIADLKSDQIRNWRQERLSDTSFFSHARFVAQDIRFFLDHPDSEPARSNVLHWLNLLKSGERYYAVAVFDAQGERRLALPVTGGEPAAYLAGDLEKVRQTHDVVVTDLHRDEANGFVHLDLVFPVFENADWKQAAPIAFVLLKLDARQFLFPLVQSWPVVSQTAETLLIRQEGNELVYLNDLRHRSGTALILRLPLAKPDLPAAKVLRGDTQVVEGIDYRGVPVVAVGRLIPGTSWGMVSKVDREEIYAPLRQRTLAALAVLAALLLAGALLMASLWHQRNARFLESELAERKVHEQEMERMNRLYAALSQVNQSVVRARSRNELLSEMCRALVHFGGCKMAWVGSAEQGSSRIVPLAHYGDEDGYLQRVELFADERPEGRCLVGTAIREGHACVCNDLLGDPETRLWQEAAAQSSWRSMAAFPIRQEGSICGVLAVYASQKDFFGTQERALIEEAAGDVSFGLDILLNDQRRQQAEGALRQARDALAQANEGLERKVAERTSQLVEANANLQSFAYTAAHDLRSPLRSIKSFSSILAEDCAGKLGIDEQSLLQRVIGSAAQMDQLLNDLLEYSKMSQAELKLEPVSLRNAVNEALALLNADAQAKNAVVTVAEPLPDVRGHLATVVLLINNLVSNALKFITPGLPAQIRISAETVALPSAAPSTTSTGRLVRLSVQDNGIGIAPEHQERIFGAFERLHSKQAYPGTGLGLAIVRKGAERMGGHVGVESEPGKGSRFWLELQSAGGEPARG